MHKSGWRIAVALVLACQLIAESSAPIGTASANGEFWLDGSRASGAGPLHEGTQVRAAATPITFKLANGVDAHLVANTEARILSNRMLLEKGRGQFVVRRDYEIQALGLRVIMVVPNSAVRIEVADSHKLEVAVLIGLSRVVNSGGIVLANITPGTSLEFNTEDNPPVPPAHMKGCLRKKDEHYFLKDETTNVTVELQADDQQILEKEVHHHIEIHGNTLAAATAAPGASQVIHVSELKRISKHCSLLPLILLTTAVVAGVLVTRGSVPGTVIPVGSNPPPSISPTAP